MLAAVGTDAVTGLVWNSRQAKTKLSATLVSSFYRLWTAEQRRAATPPTLDESVFLQEYR